MVVRSLVTVLVLAAVNLSAGALQAQEDLTRGKTPAQMFASDCADCHKNPRGLTGRGNANALAGFLRVHYTASRENAAAIAAYLVALGADPVSRTPSRPASRPKPAVTQDQSKPTPATPPAAKPGESAPKPAEPEAKPAEPKPAETKPAAPKPASEPAPATPPADPQ